MTLVAALRRLPPRSRAVVVLRYVEDHSIESVARLLDASPSAVKSLNTRGLAQLRELLGAGSTCSSHDEPGPARELTWSPRRRSPNSSEGRPGPRPPVDAMSARPSVSAGGGGPACRAWMAAGNAAALAEVAAGCRWSARTGALTPARAAAGAASHRALASARARGPAAPAHRRLRLPSRRCARPGRLPELGPGLQMTPGKCSPRAAQPATRRLGPCRTSTPSPRQRDLGGRLQRRPGRGGSHDPHGPDRPSTRPTCPDAALDR